MRTLIVFTCILNFHSFCRAQISGSNAFGKTTFIELGMTELGLFGADSIPPSYTSNDDYIRTVIWDYDQNGFDAGDPPFMGDLCHYSDRFRMQYGIDPVFSYINDLWLFDEIEGSYTAYVEYGDSTVIVWMGNAGSLELKISTILYNEKKYFLQRVQLKNNHISIDRSHIIFDKTIEPDFEGDYFGTGDTHVSVASNFPENDEALIEITGLESDSYFAIGSANPSSVIYFIEMYDTLFAGSETGYNTAGIRFEEPALYHQDSLTFSIAYIFDPEQAEEAIALTHDPIYTYTCDENEITINTIYPGAVDIGWNFAAGHIFYLQWKESADDEYITEPPTFDNVYLLAYLTPCVDYDLRLMSICKSDTVFSDVVTFKTECSNNIETALSELNISPNPTDGNLFIYVQNPESITGIKLTDLQGRTHSIPFESVANGRVDLKLQGENTGVYFLIVEFGSEYNLAAKIIVIN